MYSVDPDKTPRSASDQGLHWLPVSFLWDAWFKWVKFIKYFYSVYEKDTLQSMW